tara:strand:+ start:361 stop:1107 length:747 start_codon:yes stop_codon:yes gene_type:complete
MATILITNDDGVGSEGLEVLANAVSDLGEVWVVAPETESSAVGHGLTLRRPLRSRRLRDRVFSVDGTPTDCVNLALAEILDKCPDLILSGINKGWNIGDDITYSGTVGGALEGCLLGISSIAFSQERHLALKGDYDQAVKAGYQISKSVLSNGLDKGVFLNVNVPSTAAKGLKVTVQGKRSQEPSVEKGRDPKSEAFYWIGAARLDWAEDLESDYHAVQSGWVSVTPCQVDWTAHHLIDGVNRLLING